MVLTGGTEKSQHSRKGLKSGRSLRSDCHRNTRGVPKRKETQKTPTKEGVPGLHQTCAISFNFRKRLDSSLSKESRRHRPS